MKNIFAALAAAAVFLSGTAIATKAVQAEPKKGGTLVVASSSTPRHLNPAVQSGIATAIPGTEIFATPLRFNEKYEPQPYLAESWSVADDGLSVTLNLVKNATFHDGKPVTSEDVKFSIETVKANHPFKSMYAPVTDVATPDAHTAVIQLANPHPAILLAMSSALLPIIPKHVFGDGQDPKTHPANQLPVGSGGFRAVEHKKGEHIILERNDNYFRDGPYLDKIIYKVIQDPSNRVISMERGETHYYTFVSQLRDVERLAKSEHLEVTPRGFEAVGPINWLAFNHTRKPLDDKRVRQAISFAMDREFIINALHSGLSVRATGPIAPDSPYYSGDVEQYDVDLEKAKALLKEAGIDGEITLSIDYIPNAPEQQKNIAEYLKSQLKKIGINLELRASPDFPTWADHVRNHDFDLSMDIVFNWGDPVIGVHRTYLTDNIRKGVIWSNTQSYSNPKVDELLAQAGQDTNLDSRKAKYTEFQKIVSDELPVAWINVIPYHTAYHKNLGNPPLSVWGAMAPMDEVYWNEPPN